MRIQKIVNLNTTNFAKYGHIIENKMNTDGGFNVIMSEENYGWRIATYFINRKSTSVLERHPTSKESFEPLVGICLLITATLDAPNDYEVFLLDQPICLFANIWHQVISLSAETTIKITENLAVNSEFHYLENELTYLVVEGDFNEQ